MFSSLSDKQREIVFDKSGRFVVRACPGSGKTYSVAARLAHRITTGTRPRRGIAALSFTNAAWQEISRQLKETFGLSASCSYPHYLGTLDSFINKYIFLPFGHLVMKCSQRPVLIGEPHGSWNYCPFERCYEQYFDIVSFNVDDSLIYPKIQGVFFFRYTQIIKNDGTESQHAANLRDIKRKFWEEGFATQADANYFAVKILEKYPAIAKALVVRFPEMIIDEAQDTSEVQMKIVELFIENGLQEIAMIGDPDQAIFEWNNARPELFIKKHKDWNDNSVDLDENRRSSQKICNFTAKLTSMPHPAVAVNDDVKDSLLTPEIVSYDHDDFSSVHCVIQSFVEKCNNNNIPLLPKNIAVLVRSKNFIDIILGNPSDTQNTTSETPWVTGDSITKDIVKAKFLIDNASFKEGYKLLEKAIVKSEFNKRQCLNDDIQARIDKLGFIQHRKNIYEIVDLLPKTKEATINKWIDAARTALANVGLNLKIADNNATPIKDILQKERPINPSNQYRLGTVHSVKGETFDAVLLLLKKKGVGKHYKTLLQKYVKTDQNEELRIAYVAITRPRKLLMIAVPQDAESAWKSCFGV